jgi:hypothetical protein
MGWSYFAGTWFEVDTNNTGVPPGLPAQHPSGRAWKDGDYFDPPAPAPNPHNRAPDAAGQWYDGNYALRHANDTSFSILLDSHQRKHISTWLSDYGGKGGTKFPVRWDNADVVAYAEQLIALIPDLSTAPKSRKTLKNLKVDLAHAASGVEVKAVWINSPAWDEQQRFWSFHIYPA